MAGFDFVCPMNYPNRCDLPQTEVDYLVKDDGRKVGFLMYQFDKQDDYLETAIKSYFEPRNCHILDARNEPVSGVRICKICRLATASHFGIGVLSPQNLNAYLEFGLIWGQGKPILFVINESKLEGKKKLGDLAFDVSSFMYIIYSSKKELEECLNREGPTFLAKVRVMGIYQQELVKSVREKLRRVKAKGQDGIDFLRMLLLMGKEDFNPDFLDKYIAQNLGSNHPFLVNYQHRYMEPFAQFAFLEIKRIYPAQTENRRYYFNPIQLPILGQEAFKEIE